MWAADEDGNLVIADEYYSPGLTSAHAAEILKRRRRWGSRRCWSDPSMWAEYGTTNRWGRPASVATELQESGLDGLLRASRDRRAGYVRLLELLHVEPGRIPPGWAEVPAQDQLATRANEEHGRVLQAGKSMLDHALRAGQALLAAKKQGKEDGSIPHGQWLPWLAEDFRWHRWPRRWRE